MPVPCKKFSEFCCYRINFAKSVATVFFECQESGQRLPKLPSLLNLLGLVFGPDSSSRFAGLDVVGEACFRLSHLERSHFQCPVTA